MKTVVFAALLGAAIMMAPRAAHAQADVAPPYEDRLHRLAEIMGSIHFLSLLCQPDDGSIWREKMEEMIEIEASTALRKARLIERFNTGFDGFQAVYRQCTPSAETVLSRYMVEGEEIVTNLTSEVSE